MSSITLSAGVRQNLLSLQNTANLMATTQNRLATGKKVNSALDNPTNFFTSSSLQSRAGDLNSLLDSMSNGIKTLEAADNGLKSITKTVESMQSTLRQARQDKSFKTESFGINLGATPAGTEALSFSGGAVGTTPVSIDLTTTATGSVTAGSVSTAASSYTAPTAAQQGSVDGAASSYTAPTAATQGSVAGASSSYTAPTAAQQASVTTANSSYTAPTAATASTVTAGTTFTDIDLSSNADNTFSFDISLGGDTVSISLGQADGGLDSIIDIDEAKIAIQAQLDAYNAGAGLGVTVGDDGAGRLTFTADTAGATALTIDNGATGGTGNSAAAADLGVTDLATTGQTDTGDAAVDRVVEINGESITLTSANAATAEDAAATIQAALDTANIDITVTGNNADGTIDLAGPADGSLDITIAGADADDVFGASGTRTAVDGEEAVDRVVEINGESVTLTSANAATAEDAAATIQAALDTANIDLTVTGDNGTGALTVTGPADGSLDITIAGADADDVFGASGTRTAVTAEEAEDRVVSINGESVTLTSANAATAEDAAATIQAALDTANIDLTVTGDNGTGALSITGPADGSLDITIAGADADDVFGAAGTRTTVTAEEAVDREISVNGTAVTLTAANAATAQDAAATIQAALDTADVDVTVTGNANGSFVFTGASDGTVDVTLGGADADDVFGASGTRTAVTANDGSPVTTAKSVDALVSEINNNEDLKGKIRASSDNGRLRIENLSTTDLTVTGVSTGGEVTGGTGTSDIGGNDVRKNLVKQFNELRDQLDKLADDASFNGINLLRGDALKLTFNETGTSTIEIQAKDANGDETAVNAADLGINTIDNADFDSDNSIDSLVSDLNLSLNTLRWQASSFGSNLSVVQNRTEFTKSMMNTLQTGADALVLADTNEEAANMLALQTRQQLSSTALSLASQADQAALRLF